MTHVGKTTQAEKLAEKLGAKQVREPGGTILGESLRGLLLDATIDKTPEAAVLMHAAARAELVRQEIRPTLESGQHVVSDRSWISGAAYQGAEGVDFDDIFNVNSFALGSLIKPDLLIVLHADPEVTDARCANSGDYYESKGRAYHDDVRNRLLQIGEQMGGVFLDASLSIEQVSDNIHHVVQQRLGIEF